MEMFQYALAFWQFQRIVSTAMRCYKIQIRCCCGLVDSVVKCATLILHWNKGSPRKTALQGGSCLFTCESSGNLWCFTSDEEEAGDLWVRIKGQINLGLTVVCTAESLFKKKLRRPSPDNWRSQLISLSLRSTSGIKCPAFPIELKTRWKLTFYP